jgi:glycine/D-amino acid oxidase-like deaminating enzyme
MTSAKAWGIDSRLVTPAEIKELVPFINEEILLGGFYTPSVSCVDSLETGTQMRNEAVDKGALQVFANTEVLDIETEDGPGGPTVKAVVTNKGRIECEYVAIACGVWSPRIAKMAGANIPLTPAVHQMADVGPIDILQQSGKEVAYPIVRDMDTFCYERQSAGSNSVAHVPFGHVDSCENHFRDATEQQNRGGKAQRFVFFESTIRWSNSPPLSRWFRS